MKTILLTVFNSTSHSQFLTVDAIICDVDVVAKKGREIFYDAKVKIAVNYCHNVLSSVITEAETVEAYPEKDYAMELVYGQA